MADITVKIGRATEVMQEDRRIMTAEYVGYLRTLGYDVELEVTERVEGKYGLTPIEWTEIFVGTTVATTLISSITNDVYEATKRLLKELRKRRKRETGSAGRHLGFRVYDQENEISAEWDSTQDEDEND